MGRRELIVQELLDALDDPGAVDAVLRRHSDSKSVLYRALAVVIPIAEGHVRATAEDGAKDRKEGGCPGEGVRGAGF